MREKKPPHETPFDRPSGKPAAPLCRYEELAMRENRLRQAEAETRTRSDRSVSGSD